MLSRESLEAALAARWLIIEGALRRFTIGSGTTMRANPPPAKSTATGHASTARAGHTPVRSIVTALHPGERELGETEIIHSTQVRYWFLALMDAVGSVTPLGS